MAEARKCHYAISKDGINWETPDLGLYEFNGAGNIPWDIPGEPTSDGDYLYHVILDESSQNKKEKYKGLFGTLHRKIGISSVIIDDFCLLLNKYSVLIFRVIDFFAF